MMKTHLPRRVNTATREGMSVVSGADLEHGEVDPTGIDAERTGQMPLDGGSADADVQVACKYGSARRTPVLHVDTGYCRVQKIRIVPGARATNGIADFGSRVGSGGSPPPAAVRRTRSRMSVDSPGRRRGTPNVVGGCQRTNAPNAATSIRPRRRRDPATWIGQQQLDVDRSVGFEAELEVLT
jgi:hypothetical protein